MPGTWFITGTDRGLGRALATLVAARGDTVFAGYLQVEPESHPGILPVRLDITDQGMVQAAVARVREQGEGLDYLVNNAAILGPMDKGVVDVLDFDAIRAVFEVNALGTLRVCDAFWPLLHAGKERLIVNISSEAASMGQCWRDGWFGYGMSKAALNMMSCQFHRAIRMLGGRVLILHPGWVQTWMQGHLDANASLTPIESAEGLVDQIRTRGHESHDLPLFLDWKGDELPW